MAETTTPFDHARETLRGYYTRGARNDAVDLDADARQLVIDLGHLIETFQAERLAAPAVVRKTGDTEPIFAAARHDRSAPSADELDPVLGWLLDHGFAIQLPPARPLAVGDTVTTAQELDSLPVGAVVRSDSDGLFERIIEPVVGEGWYAPGYAMSQEPSLPARVLDLPATTDGGAS